MQIDLTEITGLDDLHHPEGVIRDAQRLAAACFGAEETLFLVGGSTAGNLAAALTVCGQGDLIVVQRNAHKSVLNGLMLAGARAVFLEPRYDPATQVAAGIRPEQVELALMRYPEAKAVWITNPNYYGMGVDVERVARAAHAHGKPLIVDEAHGAHYGFHPQLPPSALACGADLVVQSTHKMLTALTMGAMLHVQGERIDRELLRQRLSMLQSSSPSYPIMASLDASRRLLHREGVDWLQRGLQAVERAEREVRSRPCFRIVGREPTAAYETKDPFKLVLSDATGTLDGYRLRDELERRGLMVELADPRQVLLVFSLASDAQDAERLADALDDVAERFGLRRKWDELDGVAGSRTGERKWDAAAAAGHPSDVAEAMNPLAGSHAPPSSDGISEPVADAAGWLAGEMVVPYPPGIPLLYPGERISADTVRRLTELAEAGARFQGAADPRLRTIRVRADRGGGD
jgi:arginine/lysine/ornithine decarboxylase